MMVYSRMLHLLTDKLSLTNKTIMSFGISNNVRSREVRTCTPELFWKAVRSDYVATVCAGIADAWEQWKRGELAKEEYEEVKNREKKRLPIFTFHATFPGGRRLNADAVPTGLSMYDIDHLDAPREYYAHMVEERKEELGIVLAHVTPSREGLRLVFIIPAGMDLAGAQRWMSQQLNDPNYDQSVKDLARSSFAVPEDYILYIDEKELFMEREAARNEVTQFSSSGEEEYPKGEVVATLSSKNLSANNTPVSAATTPAVGHPSSPEEGNLDTRSVNPNLDTSRVNPNLDTRSVNPNLDTSRINQLTFKGIPYSEIIKQWFILAGGEPTQGDTELSNKGYDITFDHVGFAYNTGETVLKDVSFTAKQGEVTALVGSSGGGKTTVSRLAARFWDVSRGKITVGGMDISKIDPEALLSLFSIVFQDVTLFDNTILENIRIGNKDATDEQVLAAAKLANVDEFAEKLPDGWNTTIGENGCELSGGERQRISIARAFLKNAPIILLDEATASLDVENETLIQTALSRLIADKTVLVIAHRMRTVAGADKIVVLSDGNVAEEGAPEKLMKQNGLYARMVKLQTESQNWKLA